MVSSTTHWVAACPALAYDFAQSNVAEEFPALPSAAKKLKERADNSTEALSCLSSVTDRMHALLVARRRVDGLHREFA